MMPKPRARWLCLARNTGMRCELSVLVEITLSSCVAALMCLALVILEQSGSLQSPALHLVLGELKVLLG